MSRSYHKNDRVFLKPGTRMYRTRTVEEVNELYERDAREGRCFDSAGEPIIHSRQSCTELSEGTYATVISTRNVPWDGWARKPVGLVLVNLESTRETYAVVLK